MSSNADIVGTTIVGAEGLLALGILSKAAKMISNDDEPDKPKKKKDSWY